METTEKQKQTPPTTVWVAAIICISVVIFSVCAGASFAGINEARLSAANASCGHIEAVMYLAEAEAEKNGLGPRPNAFSDLLRSDDASRGASLTPYERFVLNAMLESFGENRNFDFAVTRFEDSSGVHSQIYFFPNLGRTSSQTDRYFLMNAGVVNEYNA